MGVLAAIVVFPLETRHLVHAVPPPLPPTLELLVLQTALLPYIYIFINVASPRFRFFSSSSPSLSLFLRSREFEGARTTTRRGKGFEGKQGKDRKTTSVKDSQRDRMTGERGRRAKSDEIGRLNLHHQRRIAFRGSAGTRDVQCPGCINTTSHATWFIMPTACGKSLWFTFSKLAWIRPIRWSNERRNQPLPWPLSKGGWSLKATLPPFSNRKVNRRLVGNPRCPSNRFTPVKRID